MSVLQSATHRTPGTTGYTSGCRCSDCTAAHADYQREYWRRNSEILAAKQRARRWEQRRASVAVRLPAGPGERQRRDPVLAVPYAAPAEPRPFPFDDLERHLADLGTAALALRLGVTRVCILRWRHRGLTWAQADVLAVRAGVHPSEVWGGLWWLHDGDAKPSG